MKCIADYQIFTYMLNTNIYIKFNNKLLNKILEKIIRLISTNLNLIILIKLEFIIILK